VECDGRSPLGDPVRCDAARVRRFPTWIIAGNRYEGVMSLDEIAKASRYTGDTSTSRR
jgi:hypothetical protein